jgi:hypothetical protein
VRAGKPARRLAGLAAAAVWRNGCDYCQRRCTSLFCDIVPCYRNRAGHYTAKSVLSLVATGDAGMARERFVFALAAGWALAIGLAPKLDASPVNYTFSVTATSGPLAGTTAPGTFSYDTSSIVPGGTNANTGLLTALNFTWDGITYNQTTANTGFLEFDATGALNQDLFGNHCVAGSCSDLPGFEQWSVSFSIPLGFAYFVAGDSGGFGTVTQSLATAVSEPSAVALLATGLALLALAGVRGRWQED